MDFKPFPKIERWRGAQHCTITEKIDGTNAQLVINEDCTDVLVGSRNRWITPDDDNYGFAGWVHRNKDAILTLGKGTHFGEWFGAGIQRGYGLREKRLALFNTVRWKAPEQEARMTELSARLGGLIDTVPVLYEGEFTSDKLEEIMNDLLEKGSRVAPFGNPEGVIVYMHSFRNMYKYTFDNRHKGEQ